MPEHHELFDSDGKPISVIIIKVNIASPNQISCSLGRCKSPRQCLALKSFHVPVFTRSIFCGSDIVLKYAQNDIGLPGKKFCQ